MIVLLAQYTANPGAGSAVLDLLHQMAALVKQHEPGCQLYQISIGRENPDQILIYEQYVDQQAVDFHRETPHFQELILGQIIPRLEKRTVAFYDLSVE